MYRFNMVKLKNVKDMQRNNDYDVFISYSRKDYVDGNKNIIAGNAITRLTKAFDKNGISYWIDEKGIYSGDRFAKLIANSIKGCKVFLFVSSESSNASEWTVGEIAVAREYKKKIIPFRIDDSPYNENVIVYLAPIDYASYVESPEKSIKKVVESITEYKIFLKKSEEEEQRRVASEKAKQEEQEKIKWEIKQKEIQQKEKERLAAISEERKKKEEELNAIYTQLHDLDTESAERKEKKIQLVNEIKTIDIKLSLIEKQRDQLEARRRYIEKHLSVYNHSELVSKKAHHEEKPEGALNETTKKQNLEISWVTTIEKNWYAVAVAMSAIILLGVVYLMRNNVPIENANALVVDSLEVQDSVEIESAFELELVPVEKDCVYGIDAMARISNWSDLRVSLPDEPNKLHKISFAFIKVLHGLSNYVPESKSNRENASKAGIRVAIYHVLNILPNDTKATGSAQAYNYHDYVGDMRSNELPPVLVIPSPDESLKSDIKYKYIMCALERAQQWIDEIVSLYNVTPIIHVSSYKEYKDFYKGKLKNCRFWLTSNNKDEAQFVKKPNWDKDAKYYNGIEQNYGYSNVMEINVFSGSYQEFMSFK